MGIFNRLSKTFLCLSVFSLLVVSVSAITIDELLSSYDWNFGSGKFNVSGVSYSSVDLNSNGLFDVVLFNISVVGKGNVSFSCFVGDSVFEGTKTVNNNGSLIANFSSFVFDDGFYNVSFKIFDKDGKLELFYLNNLSYFFNSSLYEPKVVSLQVDNVFFDDSDSDGLFENLVYDIGFSSLKSGIYNVSLYLKNTKSENSNGEISNVDNYLFLMDNISLGVGSLNKNFSFSSKDLLVSRFNGSVVLEYVELQNSNLDKKFFVNNSIIINLIQFDPKFTFVSGNFADSVLDSDSDGLYDLLFLSFDVFFNKSSNFRFVGSVDNFYGEKVLDFDKSISHLAGNDNVVVNISGSDFFSSNINGPYKIGSLSVYDNGAASDLILNSYTLSSVVYFSDFGFAKPDLSLQFLGLNNFSEGYSSVKVLVSNSGKGVVLRAGVELFDNNTNLLSSKSVYLLSSGEEKVLEFPRVFTGNTSTILAFVDFEDIVDEQNETNNFIIIDKKPIMVVDSVPPSSVFGISANKVGVDWIFWSWSNPSDYDFSKCILYLDGVNRINTSNNYYNFTNLLENRTYSFNIETIDSSGNINNSVVSLSAATISSSGINQSFNNTINNTIPYYGASFIGLKLQKYWVYGTKGVPVNFDSGWYYLSDYISNVSWDFGDSVSSTQKVISHTFSSVGNYSVILRINSVVEENITVFVNDYPTYDYDSFSPYFVFNTSDISLVGSVFGKQGSNGFINLNDTIMIYAVVRIKGDSNISIDQVWADTYSSKKCWNIGADFFKCQVFKYSFINALNGNSSVNLNLVNDSRVVILRMPMFDLTESSAPNISLSDDGLFKKQGSFNFNYFVNDYAFGNFTGSGIGKFEIYVDSVLIQSLKVASLIFVGNYSFNPSVVNDGEEMNHTVCFVAGDLTRQDRTICKAVVVDKKVPIFNSLNAQGLNNVRTSGSNISFVANFSDLSPIFASINFSQFNKDISSYSNKSADSCSYISGYWMCYWNNISIKVAGSGLYNLSLSYSDAATNFGVVSLSKDVVLFNRAPQLSVSNISVKEGDVVDLNQSAVDFDGDIVSFSFSGWMDSQVYRTNYSDFGVHLVNVSAFDSFGGVSSKIVSVTVNNVVVPELNIKSVSFKPAVPLINIPVMLRFVISNSGEVAARSVNWSVIDSSAVVSKPLSSFDLKVGEEMVVYSTIQYSIKGTYSPIIKVDPSNSISELDENNNNITLKIVVN